MIDNEFSQVIEHSEHPTCSKKKTGTLDVPKLLGGIIGWNSCFLLASLLDPKPDDSEEAFSYQ